MVIRRFACAAGVLFVASAAAYAAPSAEDQAIAGQLASPDTAVRRAGVEAIDRVAHDSPQKLYKTLRTLWLAPMAEAGLHDDVLRLTAVALVQRPGDRVECERLLQARVNAQLARGDPEAGLVDACRYYNVCRVSEVGVAVDYVSKCLAARPGDGNAERARRFRLYQSLAASDGVVRPPPDGVFSVPSVPLDDAPFRQSIDALRPRGGAGRGVALGNLLLMSGKPGEARGVFRATLQAAARPSDIADALEGYLSSIRAVDGTAGRSRVALNEVRDGRAHPLTIAEP